MTESTAAREQTLSPLAHELLVDVAGCDAAQLCDLVAMRTLADALVAQLELRVLQTPQLQRFPDTARGPGGVTALYLLSESHLALHTWPEHRALLISLCCCRPLVGDVALRALLERQLGPVRSHFRRIERHAP